MHGACYPQALPGRVYSFGPFRVEVDERRLLHARHDAVVPMKDGVELATGIAGARFLELDSRNHVLLPEEPAWARFAAEVDGFLRELGGG